MTPTKLGFKINLICSCVVEMTLLMFAVEQWARNTHRNWRLEMTRSSVEKHTNI